ncbi:putative RNA recognition motif domain, nucleotide-binding alpha-beta plait domain superfamily [Helianthus debilis subsp. tardiflorus]
MDGRRSISGYNYRQEKGVKGITKFYVARLPEKCSSKDIEEALGVYGAINGVYVARKRDKNGFRFGFVSFTGVKNMEELEKSMQNVWMGSFRLFINIARFASENKEGKDFTEVKNNIKERNDKEQGNKNKGFMEQGVAFNSYVTGGKSYASTVSGNQNPISSMKEVTVSEFAKAYTELHGKAILGKAKDLWTLRKLDILLKEARYGKSTIEYLGGLSILVVFKSSAEADSFRAEASGFGWFSNLDIWKGQPMAFKRIAWLNIHGVPLHLSGNETFDSVGRCFGKVLHASQRQPEDNFLTSDCVCVLTDSVKRIEEVVKVTEDGKRYKVWVEEERGDGIPDSIENQDGQMEDDEGSESGNSTSSDNLESDFDSPAVGFDGTDNCDKSEKLKIRNKKKDINSFKGSPEPVYVSVAGVSPVDLMNTDGGKKSIGKEGNEKSIGIDDIEKSQEFNAYESYDNANGNICPEKLMDSVEVGETSAEHGVKERKATFNSPRFGNFMGNDKEYNKNWNNMVSNENVFNGPLNLGFKVNLKSSGLRKGVKIMRKNKNTTSVGEETSGILRPRKRIRQNDPFDLNETIGIQEDSVSSEDQEDINNFGNGRSGESI